MKYKCRKCGRKFMSRDRKEKHISNCGKKQTTLPTGDDE